MAEIISIKYDGRRIENFWVPLGFKNLPRPECRKSGPGRHMKVFSFAPKAWKLFY